MPDDNHACSPAWTPANAGTFAASELVGGGGVSWSPDQMLEPSLWEFFGKADNLAADGLALVIAQRCAETTDPTWLWVQDVEAIRRSGRPFVHGLPPSLRSGLVHVAARRAVDALWAMEEGVRCRSLAFVVGELSGDPRALDFTASRRLVLASEANGVPLLLVRRGGTPGLSAARLRWQVESAPSLAQSWNERAFGDPACRAELFRARGFRPGHHLLTHRIDGDERASRQTPRAGLDLVSELHDRPLDEELRATG